MAKVQLVTISASPKLMQLIKINKLMRGHSSYVTHITGVCGRCFSFIVSLLLLLLPVDKRTCMLIFCIE